MNILLIHQYFLEEDGAGGSRFNEMAEIWTLEGHNVTVLAGMMPDVNGKKLACYKNKKIVFRKQGLVKVYRCHVNEAYNKNYFGRVLGYFSFLFYSFWAGLFMIKDNPDLILFSNPLYFFTHNINLDPFSYIRYHSIDFFNDRKVAFWHMQGAFVAYLRVAFIIKYLLKLPIKVTNSLEWENITTIQHIFNMSHYKMRSSLHLVLDRLSICKFFFERCDFSKIFKNGSFWTYPSSSDDFPTFDFPYYEDYSKFFRK